MSRAARFLFYAFIIWLPLPLGSNRPLFWAVNGVAACLIVFLFLLGEVNRSDGSELDWRPIAWLTGGVTVWLGWVAAQALPMMPPALSHPIWSLAPAGGSVPHSISAVPGSTLVVLAQLVPGVLLAIVAARLGAGRSRGRSLLNVIVAATTLVAAYGLAARYLNLPQVFLVDTNAYDGFLTGTFVGRNAAASYFVVGMACAAALIAAVIDERRADGDRNGRRRLAALIEGLSAAAPYILAFFVLAIATLNSGSRGGAAAGAVALLVVTLLASGRGRRSFGVPGAVAAVGLCGVFAFAALSSNTLLSRFMADPSSSDRVQLYRDTIDMIAARPFLGHGAGSYADIYPLYHQRASISLVWNKAHNTYLQLVAELGIPATAFLLALVLAALAFIMARMRRRDAYPALSVAAVASTIAIAAHALIDFSVQFQAVGMTVVILFGAAFGEACRRTRSAAVASAEAPASPFSSDGLVTERLLIPVSASGNVHPRSASDPQPPEGLRIYAFGDVHGRYDLLLRLRDAIREDAESRPASDILVVGLGDYIDRGPHSREVIEALATDLFGQKSIFLRGNHEQMLLDFLADPVRHGPSWFHAGGRETLRSFGIGSVGAGTASDVGYAAARDLLAAELSPEKVAFLERMPASYQAGGYFFAHAGARPDVALERQAVHDLLWIREGFSDRDASFEKIVVHGHVPVDRPYFGRYRINIDTGAYFSGQLTCLVLEGVDRRILDLPTESSRSPTGPVRLSQIAALHARWDARSDPARESAR